MERVRRIFQTFNYYARTDPSEADRLPFNELTACLDVADHALAELRQQLSNSDHIGELPTQPIALDAYGRTLKELNAHAERVVSAVVRERCFMIYYCEEAAIQDPAYTGHFKDIYEALKRLNLPVGFTTPSEIHRLDAKTQTLIVPPTPFIFDESLSRIKTFQKSRGRVALVGMERSFLKNESGMTRPTQGIMKPFAAVPRSGVLPLTASLDAALAPIKPVMPIDVVITDPAGKKAYGIADMFVERGFKDAGYEYIVIDDGWQIDRDAQGNIVVNEKKFPSGIKALADYVHSRGLKFGIYSDAGYKTCGGFPGSRGYEYQDARQYAAWGVDYLKYDWCNTGNQSAPDSYKLMRNALEKAGRPIVEGIKVRDDGNQEVWSKTLQDGSRAVVLFNRGAREANIGVLWTEIGYPMHLKAKIRDLWQKKDLGSSTGFTTAEVPSHGVVMLKIVPQPSGG